MQATRTVTTMKDLEKYSRQLDKWHGKQLSQTENSIKLFYRKLTRTVLAEIGVLYEKYERDGQLTYAEMQKFDRLKKFIATMTQHVNTMSKMTRNSISELLSNGYVYSYQWMGWAIEKEARRRLRYTSLKLDQ